MPASITATVMDEHPVWARCVFLEATGDAEAIRLMRLRLVRRLPEL